MGAARWTALPVPFAPASQDAPRLERERFVDSSGRLPEGRAG